MKLLLKLARYDYLSAILMRLIFLHFFKPIFFLNIVSLILISCGKLT